MLAVCLVRCDAGKAATGRLGDQVAEATWVQWRKSEDEPARSGTFDRARPGRLRRAQTASVARDRDAYLVGVDRSASTISASTACGLVIIGRCPALTLVILAFAFLAIVLCKAAGTMWSWVPSR
jgi:hypothetical protein